MSGNGKEQQEARGADLTELAQRFQPVIVTAPTARNGITLLQRLLNSTRQTIVFGENVQLVETLPALVAANHSLHYNMGPQIRQSREKFLHETTEYWSSNLWPETEPMMRLSFETFYKAVAIYDGSARQYGFHQWGIKNPMTSTQMIHRLAQLMPNARFVLIYRNPFEVVASAKARRFVQSEQQVADYARQWQERLNAATQQQDRLLMVKYEDLTANGDAEIGRLEGFTGVPGIDRKVLSRKINTFRGETADGHAPDEYIAPEGLTDRERELIVEQAGDAMGWAGYEVLSHA